jgi:hypothetical protein
VSKIVHVEFAEACAAVSRRYSHGDLLHRHVGVLVDAHLANTDWAVGSAGLGPGVSSAIREARRGRNSAETGPFFRRPDMSSGPAMSVTQQHLVRMDGGAELRGADVELDRRHFGIPPVLGRCRLASTPSMAD